MHIRELSTTSRGISLADVVSIQHTAGTDTVTATLDSLQRTAFETMESHSLRIDESAAYDTAAAYDMSANAIRAKTLLINVSDTTPPAFVSSTYDAVLNMTTVTFDERIIEPVDYTKLHIRDSGSDTGGITLSDVSPKHRINSLSVTLNASQNDAFGNLTAPQLDIDAGAVSDESDNSIAATTDRPIIQDNRTLPLVVSVEYDTNLEMLSITFDEPVHTPDYSGLRIHESGVPIGGIQFDEIPRRHQAGTMMHVILNASLVGEFNAMSEPHLAIDQDAVRDYSDNEITGTIKIPITINDTTRPSVEYAAYKLKHVIEPTITSAVYHPEFGNMTLMFNEPVTEPDLADLYVRDYVHYVSLNMSHDMSKQDQITNQSITVRFDQPHQSEIHYLDTPLFGIKRDAVSDNATNQILPFLDKFTVVDIIPPRLRIAIASPSDIVDLYLLEDVVSVNATPGDFAVEYGNIPIPASNITIFGDHIRLTFTDDLPDDIPSVDPYIAYTRTSGTIEDLSGNIFENLDIGEVSVYPIESVKFDDDDARPVIVNAQPVFFGEPLQTSLQGSDDPEEKGNNNGGNNNGGNNNGGNNNGGNNNGGNNNGGNNNGGNNNGGNNNGGNNNGGNNNGGNNNGGTQRRQQQRRQQQRRQQQRRQQQRRQRERQRQQQPGLIRTHLQ